MALEGALASQIGDFEDAVVAIAAELVGADVIVTRNVRDFKSSPVPVSTPADFLAVLGARDQE